LPRGAVLPFPHPQRLEYKLSQRSSLTHSLSLTKWSSPGHTCSYGFQAKISLTFCSQLKDLVTETATKQMARSSKKKNMTFPTIAGCQHPSLQLSFGQREPTATSIEPSIGSLVCLSLWMNSNWVDIEFHLHRIILAS
jgi:hypothetical protein